MFDGADPAKGGPWRSVLRIMTSFRQRIVALETRRDDWQSEMAKLRGELATLRQEVGELRARGGL